MTNTENLQSVEKRLDIGIVIPMLQKYGGAERFLIECLSRWQHKHDITVYATQFNPKLLAEHGVGKSVRCVELSPYFEGENSMVLNALLLPKVWRDEVGKHDIYHTHLWPTHLVDLHPMVWYPHEPLRVLHDLRFEQNVDAIGENASRNIHIYPKYNYDRLGDSVYNATLDSIDAMDKAAYPEVIVANSKYTAGYLEDVYSRNVDLIVYPGVEPDAMDIDLPVDQNLFVTISQLWPHKRVNLLLEALALTDGAQLIIIGSGPEKERLIDVSKKLGVEDRVFILSGLSNMELSLVLARACAFLFSPIKEPFGIVVLEAMAAGKPVIAVNEGGYVEACNEKNAFLVPPYPSAFAEKMRLLQSNPELAKEMGKEGKLTAPKFTWSNAATELEAIIIDTYQAYASDMAVTSNANEEMLVGIQYYLWFAQGYGAAHWNDNPKSGFVSDKPQLGYYSSTKGETIEHHLDLFTEMGLDYVIMNLHIDTNGPNGIELMGIQHMFEIVKRKGSDIKLAIQLAPYDGDPAQVHKVVEMITKLYAHQESYFKLEGKPVLFWFWTGVLDGDKAKLSRYKDSAQSFTNIGVGLRIPDGVKEAKSTFGLFDGFTPFSPLELSDESHWERIWLQAYHQSEKAGFKYSMATVSPGYDDTDLQDELRTGNPYRKIERLDGKTYKRGFDFVRSLDQKPDLLMISTFNEYHENSHIEPSLRHGDQYIRLTKSLIESVKAKKG